VSPRHNSIQRFRDKAPACDPLAGGSQQFLGPRLHSGRLFHSVALIAGQGAICWRRGEAGAFEGDFLNEWGRQPGYEGSLAVSMPVTRLSNPRYLSGLRQRGRTWGQNHRSVLAIVNQADLTSAPSPFFSSIADSIYGQSVHPQINAERKINAKTITHLITYRLVAMQNSFLMKEYGV